MTLEEVQQSLPNGLHDARIISITLDYVQREATFELDISFTDADKKGPEIYQSATLCLRPFFYCIIEAPDPKYPFADDKPLWIDAGCDKLENAESIRLPEPLPKGAFTCWFFVKNWNSFVHIAALDAEIVLHDDHQRSQHKAD
jgi:hypothetical protein